MLIRVIRVIEVIRVMRSGGHISPIRAIRVMRFDHISNGIVRIVDFLLTLSGLVA